MNPEVEFDDHFLKYTEWTGENDLGLIWIP